MPAAFGDVFLLQFWGNVSPKNGLNGVYAYLTGNLLLMMSSICAGLSRRTSKKP